MNKLQHMTICICTYNRSDLLQQLLEKLKNQKTENLFTYSIIIVDNDKGESARETVKLHGQRSSISIKYYVEPKQNIALARNKAIENAAGDFVCFIDDDEFPSKSWLINLYNAFYTYKPTGGILGPVIPYYPKGTPGWLIKSKLCDRPNHPTGTQLDWYMTRTGNVMMLRNILDGFEFKEEKGRVGGEDKELFKRLIENGYSFIWCREAEVNEVVYSGRWKLSFYLYRSLMMGGASGKAYRKNQVSYPLRSFISFLCYCALLFISIFMGKHYVYKRLIRVTYDFARLMGYFGVVFVKGRRSEG